MLYGMWGEGESHRRVMGGIRQTGWVIFTTDISAPDRAGPKPIQCSRAAHLAPYLAFLEEVGAPVDRELRRARLPTLVTEDPNLYLADERARAFLRAIADREGIDDLPVRAVSHSDLWNLSATVGDAIAWSPTLYLALKQFCRYSAVEDSALNAWITEDETTIRVSCLNRTPLDPFSGRIEDWNEMAVASRSFDHSSAPSGNRPRSRCIPSCPSANSRHNSSRTRAFYGGNSRDRCRCHGVC